RMFQVLAQTGALARVMPGLHWDDRVLATELVRAAQAALGLPGRFALACRLSEAPQHVASHIRAPSECQDYARLLPLVLAAQTSAGTPEHDLEVLERCDA